MSDPPPPMKSSREEGVQTLYTWIPFNVFTPSSLERKVFSFMGEAMMFRYPGASGKSNGNYLVTEIFKENGNFCVPKGVTEVQVTLFGGGGSGNAMNSGQAQDEYQTIAGSAGGGGGWMNKNTVTVTPGD